MKHTIITRRKLRAWGACYSPEYIRELVPAAGLTPLEILGLDIPPADRLWVVLRKSVIPKRELRLLACLWATRALDRLPPEKVDPRSREAVRVAIEFAEGRATEEQLHVAAEAAWAAAKAEAWAAGAAAGAAWAAAKAEAWAAGAGAAAEAAWEAAEAAKAEAAARDAAWEAAWAEASRAHIEDVRHVLRRLAAE